MEKTIETMRREAELLLDAEAAKYLAEVGSGRHSMWLCSECKQAFFERSAFAFEVGLISEVEWDRYLSLIGWSGSEGRSGNT